MKKIQVIIGLALASMILLYGFVVLETGLIFRLVIGLVIGYALGRGAYGFAGSVNRAYRFGSTKLLRSLMFLFAISSIGTAVLLLSGVITTEKFWINPINLGLLLGGFLFGIGMALASCCASGVLTSFKENPLKAIIVIIFFGIGVFVGFPIQKSGDYSWVNKTWFHTSTSEKGVYFVDWFKGPFDGLLGGVIVVIILSLAFTYGALFVEKLLKNKGKYKEIESEVAHKEITQDELPLNPVSKGTYDFILGNPWSLRTAAFVLTSAFLTIMVVTKGGWGVSTVFGLWIGKILMIFGVSEAWVTEFTYVGAGTFAFDHPVSIQNIAILLGALIAILTMGKLKISFKISWRELIVFVVGGFLLGFGTRLSNGCNVGALYSPIAQFSLSGWFFLVFMIIGGVLGNFILKKILK